MKSIYYVYRMNNRSRLGYKYAKFRYDPIPHTGCYKSGIRGIFRHPRTTSELRQLSSDRHNKQLNEYHVKYRKGRYKNLPEEWDDISIADSYNRGWKRTKKRKQWLHPERLPKCKRTGDIVNYELYIEILG